jgi:phenylpropionate dioxygenase-like ring-hydroxylating dioxygenase large terminal subunit
MLGEIDTNSGEYGVLEPDDPLSPRHFAGVRKRGLSHQGLPLWTYTSKRFFDAEMERLFRPNWNLLEREELVAKPGDYHTLTFMNVPLILARDNAGKVRLFANTCPHRGALVATGKGNCKSFRCPYHSWVFSLEGKLMGAPAFDDANDKPLIDDTNKHEYSLFELPCDTWGGFVFMKFRKSPQTLAEHLGALPQRLASHRLEDMVCAKRKVYDMQANWKAFVENYSDALHIPNVHRDSLARWHGTRVEEGPTGEDTTATFVAHDKGSMLLLPFPGYDGFPAMEHIREDRKRGTYFVTVRAGMMMTLGNDGALVFNSEPITPTTSRLTVSSLFPKSTVARDDFRQIAENYYRRNGIVVQEDVDISNRQAMGLNSPYARMPRLCKGEARLNDIHNWILDRVVPTEKVA